MDRAALDPRQGCARHHSIGARTWGAARHRDPTGEGRTRASARSHLAALFRRLPGDKGWIERVFTLGFAFGLKPEAWRGDIRGRIPLLTHRKALIINTTIFDEQSYRDGLGDAMKTLIDEFALRYPGIQKVEHVYFYAVHGADDATRQAYLERAYRLGLEFAR
jgi:hypothetical protein